MEINETFHNIFTVGQKYTIYRIGSLMAMTTKLELTVKEVRDDGIVYTPRKKRKMYLMKFQTKDYQTAPLRTLEAAIFAGWDQPIKTDCETGGVMRGNACMNFVASVEDIRKWIDTYQLNPFFHKTNIVAITPNPMSPIGEGTETVVYPELVEPGRHAVIDGIIAKSA